MSGAAMMINENNCAGILKYECFSVERVEQKQFNWIGTSTLTFLALEIYLRSIIARKVLFSYIYVSLLSII